MLRYDIERKRGRCPGTSSILLHAAQYGKATAPYVGYGSPWARASGAVEVDEPFVGAPEEDVHGRETEDEAMVIIASSMNQVRPCRLR
ncbi:MAG: hypothetical protein ACREV4_00165 [Gammaproteobacteria bacterium]